jgi:protein ECT2
VLTDHFPQYINLGCSTPTIRRRAHIFNLDVNSRKLFSARPGSAKGDLFGGSVSGSRSSVSKSSTDTQTTTTADDSLMKFSSHSNSTVTVATTMSILDDEAFFGRGGSSASRSRSWTRKLLKWKSKSPGSSGSDPEIASPRHPGLRSNAGSRSISRERGFEYSDPDDDDKTLSQQTRDMDKSDEGLSMRLALIHKNSQSQHGQHVGSLVLEQPIEGTIYEGEHYLWEPASRPLPLVSDEEQQLRGISTGSAMDKALSLVTSLAGNKSVDSLPYESTHNIEGKGENYEMKKSLVHICTSLLYYTNPLADDHYSY